VSRSRPACCFTSAVEGCKARSCSIPNLERAEPRRRFPSCRAMPGTLTISTTAEHLLAGSPALHRAAITIRPCCSRSPRFPLMRRHRRPPTVKLRVSVLRALKSLSRRPQGCETATRSTAGDRRRGRGSAQRAQQFLNGGGLEAVPPLNRLLRQTLRCIAKQSCRKPLNRMGPDPSARDAQGSQRLSKGSSNKVCSSPSPPAGLPSTHQRHLADRRPHEPLRPPDKAAARLEPGQAPSVTRDHGSCGLGVGSSRPSTFKVYACSPQR